MWSISMASTHVILKWIKQRLRVAVSREEKWYPTILSTQKNLDFFLHIFVHKISRFFVYQKWKKYPKTYPEK